MDFERRQLKPTSPETTVLDNRSWIARDAQAIVAEILMGDAADSNLYYEGFRIAADNYQRKWTTWLSNIGRFIKAEGSQDSFARKSDFDFAQEQAERENAELMARESASYESWESMTEPVLNIMKKQKENDPSVAHEKTVVVFLGGSMAGAIGSGYAKALQDLGYDESVISAVATVSAGGGNGLCLVSGQADVAARLFAEQCTTKNFLDFSRAIRNIPQALLGKTSALSGVLNAEYIGNLMRQGEYAVDTDRVRNSMTDLYVVATDADTNKAELLDVKKDFGDDMILGMEATSAIPLFREPVQVGDKRYKDGAIGEFPLQKIIERTGATNVLILSNHSFSQAESSITYTPTEEDVIAGKYDRGSLGSLNLSPTTDNLSEVFKMKETQRRLLEDVQGQTGARIGYVWAPATPVYDGLTNDPGLVPIAIQEGYDHLKELLS